MNFRWHVAAPVAILATLLAPVGSVHAQTEAYPSRPFRILVPFPPGGSVDTVARLIAPKLGEGLGQPIVIDNRSGASGNIGTEQVARAKPDGYTLLINTVPLTSNPHLFKQLSFDVLVDSAPIMLISSSPSLVVVHPSVPARTVLELVDLAPELAKRFDEMGLDIVASTPDAFGTHLKSEHEKWGRLVKERNIRNE
ncbi:MAG: Bug family tripartite tricarboxylate transporter substrate binding protein [Burkholderiales bacterium]